MDMPGFDNTTLMRIGSQDFWLFPCNSVSVAYSMLS